MTQNIQFAARMGQMQKSFIREILKLVKEPGMISFAGGLPNPATFPVTAVQAAANKVLSQQGHSVLQYGLTPGYLPLREWIAQRYAQKYGMSVSPDDILITNGSQQGIDLIGKVMLDPGDTVLVEAPSYLGGLHALRMYEPRFATVPLLADGVDTAVLRQQDAKLFYMLPNFQNPTGISYSAARRREVADILRQSGMIFIEDDPYNELRFAGHDLPPIYSHLPERGFLMGSFSKAIAPGLRIGWICAAPPLMDKLIIAKQGADLHANQLAQAVIHQFLIDNDVEAHLQHIRAVYKTQRDAMVDAIRRHFPAEIQHTMPDGGMFLWATLPNSLDAMALFAEARQRSVIFVPGAPSFVDGSGQNTLRLSYSTTPPDQIETGIQRLAAAIAVCLNERVAT